MSAAVTIRPAEPEDAATMVALLAPIIAARNLTAIEGPLEVAEQRRFIESFPADGTFFVAIAEDRLVGMQDVIPRAEAPAIGEISTFVMLDTHRRGIGGALTARTLEECRARGIAELRATIRPENTGARGFYRAMGFRPAAGATNDAPWRRAVGPVAP